MERISISDAIQAMPDFITKDMVSQPTHVSICQFLQPLLESAIYELRTGAYAKYDRQSGRFNTVSRTNISATDSAWEIDPCGTNININEYTDGLRHINDDEYDIIRVFLPEEEKLHTVFERPDIERTEALRLVSDKKKTKTTYFPIIRHNANTDSIIAHTTTEVMDFVKKLTKQIKPDTKNRIRTAVETILPCMEHISTIEMTFPDSHIKISIVSTITTAEKEED